VTASPGSQAIAALGLEQLVRDMPVAVGIVDVSGRVIHSNERARDLTDRQLGGAMPGHLDGGFDIFRPDGRRYAREEWPVVRSITSGEHVVDEECFYPLANGGRLFMRCSSSPVRNSEGEIVAGVLVMVDTTEDRQVADRLAYYERLLETSEDAVIAVDSEMRVTLFNTAAERLYGWRAEEVQGRDSADVSRPIMGAEARARVDRELAEEGRSRAELTVCRRDGSLIDVEWVATVVPGPRGEVLGYLGVHRDITGRRRAEREREIRTREQAAVAELGLRALAIEGVQGLMDDACALVARTLEIELTAVAEILSGRERLLLRAGHGWNEGVVTTAIGDAGRGSLVGHAVEVGAPVVSDDVAAEPRFTPSPLLVEHGVVSAATVLIGGREEPYGALVACSRRSRTFSADDVHFLQAVANVISMVLERVAADRRLHEVRVLAESDGLTGLLNRRRFEEELDRHAAAAARYGRPAALLLIDLDDFKAVNDRYGHAAGDELLRRSADVLRGRLRGIDRAARIGGDEFAVILDGAAPAAAARVAEELTTDIAAIQLAAAPELRASASVGVSAITGDGAHRAFTAADEAMYATKRQRPEAPDP
jgi:diguanylate cyclase (GGDEF)-like protein/PAS domain S-box-containing protein